MSHHHTTEHLFSVTEMHQAGSDVYRVILEPDSGLIPEYWAGQYLEIDLGNGQRNAFSIASAPVSQQKQLELHIQKIPDSPSSDRLFHLLHQGKVNTFMPSGRCFLPDPLPASTLVFVAAGTGFAQMKSMVEHCLDLAKQNPDNVRDIHLYWGARTPADFYLPYLPIQWADNVIHYHPIVSDASDSDDWCGRHGLVYEAILEDKKSLLNGNFYLSGSPSMVYTTIDVLLASGFTEEQMHSDVFDYAPRQ